MNPVERLGKTGAVALLALPLAARADVLVEDTGRTYPTIQEAVDNAPIGGTLRVHAGTYVEAVVIDRDLAIFGDGADVVTVRWTGAGPDGVFELAQGLTVTLSGMTVGSTVVRGISADRVTSLTLEDLDLSGQNALYGGGLYVTGGVAELTRVTVRDAVADQDGGGIFADGVRLRITDSLFTGNRAPGGNGGALYADGGTLDLSDTSFAGNSADDNGGAIALVGAGATAVKRSSFCANSAAFGGAVAAEGGAGGLFAASIFDANAAGTAAALHLTGGPWAVRNDAFLNHAGTAAQVVFFAPSSVGPEVHNSLFAWNPAAGLEVAPGSDDPLLAYNAFFANLVEVHGANLDAGNLLDVDPELTLVVPNGDCSDDRLWPLPSSPLIDRGDPDPAFDDPDGSRNDIGAFGGPDAPEWVHADQDRDGHGFLVDCDDLDGDNFPGNPEVCDGGDNDCDGRVDADATDAGRWYVDADRDTWGSGTDPGILSCEPDPQHPADNGQDCDDSNPDIHPGVEENCDPLDWNCDGDPYRGAPEAGDWYPDRDEDGYGNDDDLLISCDHPGGDYIGQGGDCNDGDPYVHPDQAEVACDGVDENCADGEADHPDSILWWPDVDADLHGDEFAYPVLDCLARTEHVNVGDDCDDGNPARFAGNPEVCDGVDNDCNQLVDDGEPTTTWWPDADGDGRGSEVRTVEAYCQPGPEWIQQGGDCDDTNPAVYQGAPEICDGIDDDCDELVDLEDEDDVQGTLVWTDEDGDGYGAGEPQEACDTAGFALEGGDCRDFDPSVNPGAAEVAGNDIDENCDDVMDDAPSDQVHEKLEPKGCGCDAAGTPGGAPWLAATLLALAAGRRRR